jgi:DNA-binding transcriptional LysR family regulator
LDIQVPQLRAFEAVARLQSYAVAAEQLSYSAPSVYLQVKGLEKTLGLRLVRRQRKQVLLTREGEQVLPTVIDLLDRIAVVGQAARALHGRVVVGSGPNTAVSWVMPIVARYQAEHPDQDVDIEIEAGSAADLVQGVVQGRVDIAVGGIGWDALPAEGGRSHRLVLVPWGEDAWDVFGAPETVAKLRAGNARAPLRVFRYQNWRVPSYEMAMSYLAARLGAPVELIDGGSIELVRGAVANQLGLGILPRSARLFLDERRIVRVCGLGAHGQLPLRVLHRRPRLLADPVRGFLGYLLRARPARPRPAPDARD